MSSLVQELQRDAISPAVAITDLLRKAYLVARKLKVAEFEIWTKRELDGYTDLNDNPLPSYRKLVGNPSAFNPHWGWQPIQFEDADVLKTISTTYCTQSAAFIEHAMKAAQSSGHFEAPHPVEWQREIQKANRLRLRTANLLQPASYQSVLDTVRNTVLEWSLKLEEDGILGEGISFTPNEIQSAHDAKYSVAYFIGDVSNSQLQLGTTESTQALEASKT